jgi:tetratricopeptide (TPR) repeat protein
LRRALSFTASQALLVLFFAMGLLALDVAQGATQSPPPSSPAPQEAAPQTPPLSPRQAEEMRADVLKARKMYQDAIEVYQGLLKQDPKSAGLHNKIGVCYSQLLRLDQAKKSYERAIKLSPKFSEAINNLATVHYYQKRFKRAVKLYQRAIAIQPDSAIFYGNLGYAYFADKKYDEAMNSFQRALELDATIFEQRGGAGSVLTTRSSEERGRFFFFMAKAHATLGNAERCAHYLKRAIEEGYKDLASVEKDPAFAKVINDPQVKEVLQPPSPAAPKPVS